MILPVITYPDSRLRKIAKPIRKVTKKVKKTANSMIETMDAMDAVGISGTQVDYHKRLIVVKDLNSNEHIPMINPEIIYKSEELFSIKEGCLSFPTDFYTIKRPEVIKVKYKDLSGSECFAKASKILSITIQHEIDHLNGILFIDYNKY